MRRAHIPHVVCGLLRTAAGVVVDDAGRRSRARARTAYPGRLAARAVTAASTAILAIASIVAAPMSARAQDPSVKVQQLSGNKTFTGSTSSMFGNAPKINSALPLNLQADQLLYDTKGRKVIARGNVEIFYNNNVLTADEVTYDQNANLLTARGNVQLRDANGNVTRAENLQVTDDFRDAFVETLSVVAKDETRIAARTARRRDGNVNEYEDAKFTPCRNDPGKPPLWCISAARIVHDQRSATIQYQDARFEFFGMPVVALPYFEHADPSVKRRTGFLAPTVGTSTTLGFKLEVPYYFALSPHYDFTFSPEYLSKQGMLWKGEYRQRFANGQVVVRGGFIDQDVSNLAAADANPKLDGWRGTLSSVGLFSLGSWWKAGWDVTLESDRSFRRFYGFDVALQTDRVNTAYITGLSDRNYFNAQLYHFGGLLLDDSAATSGARVHPVLDYNYIFANSVLGGELSFTGHARSMSRSNTTDVTKTALVGSDTTHAVAEMSWRRRLIDGIGQTWTPFVSARGDAYSFRDTRDPVTGFEAPSDSRLFGVGTAALTYAYPFVAHTASASHVVEPIVQIVSRHMNRPDQRLLPSEDAKSLVFDEGLLFDLSKTSGYDRIDTGTRANAGVQYSFQATNGFHVRTVFGQSFHLGGQNVFADPGRDVTSSAAPGTFASTFNPASGLETNRSDYVAGVYVSPLRNFTFVSQARFDERDWTLRRNESMISGVFGPVSGQLAYSYTHADPLIGFADSQRELQAAIGLKLTDNWSLLAQMRYDLDDNKRLQDSLMLRYQDECFVLSGTFSEVFYTNTAQGIKPDRTFMLRFELKHLGEFNYKSDVTSFLARGVNQ